MHFFLVCIILMKIDLLKNVECAPVSGDLLYLESMDYHTVKQDFLFWPLHDKAVNPRIEAAAPANSLILDIGAGTRLRRLDPQKMRKRNQRFLTLDYQWPHTIDRDLAAAVRFDLRKTPRGFAGEAHVCQYILAYQKLLAREQATAKIEAMRRQLGLLYGVLREQEIGTVIFSHVMVYLPREVQRLLLTIAARSLMPGGTIHCICMSRSHSRHIAEYPPGPSEMLRLPETFPDMQVTDNVLLAPSVGGAELEEFERLSRSAGKNAAGTFLADLIEENGNVHIEELPAVLDDPEFPKTRDLGTGRTTFLREGVRLLSVKKMPAKSM